MPSQARGREHPVTLRSLTGCEEKQMLSNWVSAFPAGLMCKVMHLGEAYSEHLYDYPVKGGVTLACGLF